MAFNRDKALAAAAKFAAKGQHDRAAKEYAAVVEADPSDIRSWLLYADALRQMGDTAGASERFMFVGKHYTEAGEHQKALAVYRQVLQIDSGRLDVQAKVAGLYKDLNRIQDAIATYEFVAQAYFQSGQIAEGLEGFRMVAELDPGAVGKRLRLAELYSREGMVPQAVEHFRLAADKLFADRRIDDYIRVAERLIYHKEDDLPVLRSLARIYLSQNENRRALVKLNALLRSAPADPEGLELLADTFVALGKQDKSVSVLQELAKEQRKGGRKAKVLAARVLRKAIALGPENAEELEEDSRRHRGRGRGAADRSEGQGRGGARHRRRRGGGRGGANRHRPRARRGSRGRAFAPFRRSGREPGAQRGGGA
ncbi:tetratricopeptide repeat protein [Nannocystis pusilla]|uniref:tetratricopeptide repeat protein n=1 Tax=Nannocystis pusilla TaxID=889268 RepID=UPI003DA2E9DF